MVLVRSLRFAQGRLFAGAQDDGDRRGLGQETGLSTYTEQDDGQAVSLKVGEQFEVRLAENASTGHRWQLADIDRDLLDMTRDEPIPPDSAVPGASGAHAWTFLARTPGQCPVRFVYRRSWEGAAPAQTFSLAVTVT
jgi:predicted secreted protein